MIQAILFDLDGTLIDRSAAHRGYCAELWGRRPDVFPPERREGDVRVLIEVGKHNSGSFARRAARAFPGLGTADELAAEHARRLPEFVRPDPAVVRLLQGLRERYRLGLLSNGSGPSQRAKLEAAGLLGLLERVFISGEQRAAKPHEALFRKAVEWTGSAERTLLVGDDPVVDIAGAARVGMRTCWVSGRRFFPKGIHRPEWTIEQVHELPEVLP
jgi:putative hydrolase of the HAD superfamily